MAKKSYESIAESVKAKYGLGDKELPALSTFQGAVLTVPLLRVLETLKTFGSRVVSIRENPNVQKLTEDDGGLSFENVRGVINNYVSRALTTIEADMERAPGSVATQDIMNLFDEDFDAEEI